MLDEKGIHCNVVRLWCNFGFECQNDVPGNLVSSLFFVCPTYCTMFASNEINQITALAVDIYHCVEFSTSGF